MASKAPQLTTKDVAMLVSSNLGFVGRARFIKFVEAATVGHWAEVVDAMRKQLIKDGHDPDADGAVR